MHYANGREAKIGDHVVGRGYNRKGLIAGTVISVTPGADSCSTLIAYNQTKVATPGVPLYTGGAMKAHGTQGHGSAGEQAVTTQETDYTHCGNLLHVDDLADSGDLLKKLASQP